ncbi:hypothetical protein EIN_080180 [Entamoeba invadens IP1]|uniref:hypothetical protein n=1 Tax=Entamoeba invadens IP1 TaxID=370355 RepID=UPI0002C3DC09|nr:hypothetical protein EIN_080180 [Entamoeba invadens IP1]ELP85066.1 hypothetical protein EIN_080180 [Entamoeba invadens IP1]|eukprot:XP_004184412.1 hypothetical protein EIN_080180 [Entamoeba invadens IP1]
MNLFKNLRLGTLREDAPTQKVKEKPQEYSIIVIDMRYHPDRVLKPSSQLPQIYVFLHGKPKTLPQKYSYTSDEVTISSPYKLSTPKIIETQSLYNRDVKTCCASVVVNSPTPFCVIAICLNSIFGAKENGILENDKVLSTEELVLYYLFSVFKLPYNQMLTFVCGDFLSDIIDANNNIKTTPQDTSLASIDSWSNEEAEFKISELGDSDLLSALFQIAQRKDRLGSLARSEIVAKVLTENAISSTTLVQHDKLPFLFVDTMCELYSQISTLVNATKKSTGIYEFVNDYTQLVAKKYKEHIEGGLTFFQLFRGLMKYSRVVPKVDIQTQILLGTLKRKVDKRDIDFQRTNFPKLSSFEIKSALSPSFMELIHYFNAVSPEIILNSVRERNHLHILIPHAEKEDKVKCVKIDGAEGDLWFTFIVFDF